MAFGPVAPNSLGAPNTGSTIQLNDGVNKTSTSISTNIVIMVNNQAVGAVQSFLINETRPLKNVNEVGTDGIVDITPNQSATFGGTCSRIRFDRMRIAEAFSRGFVHVHSQVYPFDIVILDRQKRDQSLQISTVIKNVWIKSMSYTYNANDWVITDTMGWDAETIFSFLGGGGGPGENSVAIGGERGIKHFGGGQNGEGTIILGNGVTNIEQLVDTGSGGRRGSMDAAGIIDLADSGSLF